MPTNPPLVNTISKREGDNLVVECEFMNTGNVPSDFLYGVTIGKTDVLTAAEIPTTGNSLWHDVDIYNDGKGQFDLVSNLAAGAIAVGTRSMTIPNDVNIETNYPGQPWDVWITIRDAIDNTILYDEYLAKDLIAVDDPAFVDAEILRIVLT